MMKLGDSSTSLLGTPLGSRLVDKSPNIDVIKRHDVCAQPQSWLSGMTLIPQLINNLFLYNKMSADGKLTREDVLRIRTKYPNSIPVVMRKDPKLKYNWYSSTNKNLIKMLVPETMSMFDLKLQILSKLKTMNNSVTDAIYISCDGNILTCNSVPMSLIFSRHNDNGALYMELHGENAFG